MGMNKGVSITILGVLLPLVVASAGGLWRSTTAVRVSTAAKIATERQAVKLAQVDMRVEAIKEMSDRHMAAQDARHKELCAAIGKVSDRVRDVDDKLYRLVSQNPTPGGG